MTEPFTLYTRAGCHLCEDAEATLARLGVPYTRMDISGNADLEARYGWDVPVLTRGDRTLLKGVLSAARVRAKLHLLDRASQDRLT